jgi:hypothetical protein
LESVKARLQIKLTTPSNLKRKEAKGFNLHQQWKAKDGGASRRPEDRNIYYWDVNSLTVYARISAI